MSSTITDVIFDNQELLIPVGAGVVIFAVLLGLLGFGGLVGSIAFLVYGAVWLGVIAFVLWLFYRLVTAAERIASAQERIARAREAGATDADSE